MESLLEFLFFYFQYLLITPVMYLYWVKVMPLYMALWFLIGLGTLIGLKYFKNTVFTKPFISIWFMPGTVICGAATTMPWPLTIFSYVSGNGCTPLFALSLSLLFNFLFVYGVYAIYNYFRKI